MFGEKRWWQSRTIMATVVSVVLKGLAVFGVGTDMLDEEQLTAMLLMLGSLISDMVAIWGRLRATTTVG